MIRLSFVLRMNLHPRPWPAWSSLLLCLGMLIHFRAEGALPSGWRFLGAYPQGQDLLCTWAAGTNDLFAGGHGGTIVRWNGQFWTNMPTPNQKTVLGFHGTAPTNVWAVGGDEYTLDQTNRGLILRFNGQQWVERAVPQLNGWTYVLTSVLALGLNDVWATIDSGTTLLHWNGTAWSYVYLPLTLEGRFQGLTAVGTNHLFAYGTHGQIAHLSNGVWHLEQKLDSGNFTANILTHGWAPDLTNVYVAGSLGQVYRRNLNGSWQDLGIGTGFFGSLGMTGIWGRSPQEIYLFGVQSIRLFNGSTVTVTNDYTYTMRRQWFAAAGYGDRMFAVGPNGVTHEYLTGSSGAGTLSPLSAGGLAEAAGSVRGAAPFGEGVACFNSYGPPQYFDGVLVHQFPKLPEGMTSQGRPSALHGTSQSNLVMAWLDDSTFGRGVHRWDGKDWQALGASWAAPTEAVAFWRSPTDRLYACGPYRVMVWDNTNAWNQLYILPPDEFTTQFTTIWGRSDSEIYVGAANGRVLRYDGSAWSNETTPTNTSISCLAGNTTNTFAVGPNGTALRRVGTAWQRLAGVEVRDGDNFASILTVSNVVYAAQQTAYGYTGGGQGRLWKLSGATATKWIDGLSQPILALATNNFGRIIALGDRGHHLTDMPMPAGFALQRLDLNHTNWTALGSSGVEIRVSATNSNRPMVAAWRLTNPPALFSSTNFESVSLGGQQWAVICDTFYAGQSLPPRWLRLTYDPARLPAGLDVERALAFGSAGSGWTNVSASVVSASQWVMTLNPVTTPLWTFGSPPFQPSLLVARQAGGQLQISWPISSVGYFLQATDEIGNPSGWSNSPGPFATNGDRIVLNLDPSSPREFYRLRKGP